MMEIKNSDLAKMPPMMDKTYRVQVGRTARAVACVLSSVSEERAHKVADRIAAIIAEKRRKHTVQCIRETEVYSKIDLDNLKSLERVGPDGKHLRHRVYDSHMYYGYDQLTRDNISKKLKKEKNSFVWVETKEAHGEEILLSTGKQISMDLYRKILAGEASNDELDSLKFESSTDMYDSYDISTVEVVECDPDIDCSNITEEWINDLIKKQHILWY